MIIQSAICRFLALVAAATIPVSGVAQNANLIPDPSIEQTRPKNQIGVPFMMWSGWILEGSSEFRNGQVARTGKTSAEMVGSQSGKIRLYTPAVTLDAGKYRFSCYIRGLEVGPGVWGTCEDLNMADERYYPLKKSGTFGWTRLEIVKEIKQKQEVAARIGLWGPGRLWVDDAELIRVPDNTTVSVEPIWSPEEKPISAPGVLDNAKAVRCPDCGYLNMPDWGRCYACGASLESAVEKAEGPPEKILARFEDGKIAPFTESPNGAIVQDHATVGNSLRIDKDYFIWSGNQNWTGYDFFVVDVYNGSGTTASFYFEVLDAATTDYWTRVNYNTVIPPGQSKLVIPTDLYVGEKSRPGRPLDQAHVKLVALNIGESKGPIYFSNLRLERDLSDSVHVDGLMAFDFGPGTNKPFGGFIQVTPSTQYSPWRGYGLKNAQIWRAYDALQPEPLYQTGICIESGSFAIDLPDGGYHVFVNIDSPSGFWGEYQVYRQRIIKANGVEVVHDKMDLASFMKRYFRLADVDDSPNENTFDKYQRAYFQEKEFDVDVKGGQLTLEFLGENWANYVSTLVLYPSSHATEGRKWLDNLRERRRFYFDNYFKRILPDGRRDAKGAIPEWVPTPQESAKGYVLWSRDWMQDVPVNAFPRRSEVVETVSVAAAAGQMEPIVFSITPLRDLGTVKLVTSVLRGPGGALIPFSSIKPGVVSHRLTRVTAEGSVYTIAPRLIMPKSNADIKKDVTTTFWLTLKVPAKVKAGVYRGTIALTFANGKKENLAIVARLFATPLDALDVPAGPWGCTINLPWYAEEVADYNEKMLHACLAKMREYGLAAFSGVPTLRIKGWKDGKPDIDFTQADKEMAATRAAGFKMVVNYNGGIQGFDNYFVDEGAMRNAGFTNYVDFLRPILASVDEHAKANNWLPVGFNLCDEPLDDAAKRSAENALAWREASPSTLLTTGATSIESPKPDNPHLPLVKALKIADLNGHGDAAIKLIHDAGNDWAFYNDGNRWTFGVYMYKCAKQYGMKFRLSWHWNASAGDPYYALDCREDDYAWCVTNAIGELIPTIHFDRDIRAGVDDYRAMQTLARLIKEKPNHPAAAASRKLLDDKLASFKLGERVHAKKWPSEEYASFRLKVLEAMEVMSK